MVIVVEFAQGHETQEPMIAAVVDAWATAIPSMTVAHRLYPVSHMPKQNGADGQAPNQALYAKE